MKKILIVEDETIKDYIIKETSLNDVIKNVAMIWRKFLIDVLLGKM